MPPPFAHAPPVSICSVAIGTNQESTQDTPSMNILQPIITIDGTAMLSAPRPIPFSSSVKDWTKAVNLRAGDLLRTHDDTWATVQVVAVEEAPVHQLVPGVMPYPVSGLFPAGTLIPTSTGLKKIEDIKIGDYDAVPSPERN